MPPHDLGLPGSNPTSYSLEGEDCHFTNYGTSTVSTASGSVSGQSSV